jgi:outer membrane protein assembly factor BamB
MNRGIVTAIVCAGAALAQWPQFRGPNGSGVSESARLPVHFGRGENVLWRTELPAGHSSPIVMGDRIFLTAAESGKRVNAGSDKVVDEGGRLFTICLDRGTGKILWKRQAPRPRVEAYQPTNSPASPTPVADSQRVYVFFGDYGLLAYTLDGKDQWQLPLGPFNNQNGHGSSPILAGGFLVLVCDQDTDSYLLAVDKESGRIKWKTPRPEVTRSYTTPAIFQPPTGPPELIVPGSYQLTSYNARTGAKLWWITGMSWQPKSTPVIDGEIIYAHWWENGGESEAPTETLTFAEILDKYDTNRDRKISREELASEPRMLRGFADNDLASDGFLDERDWEFYRARRSSRNALIAVKGGGRGDLTGSGHIVWRMQKFLPNVPSPLVYNGTLFLIKDGGILTSLDPKSGQILKQGRLPGALGTYYASPVGGAGHVYVISQSGKMTVLTAAGQWEIVATIDLDDEAYATPAIADDCMYVRTRSALYCFKAGQSPPVR